VDNTERRRTERYPASENRARFLWEEGPDVRETSARLVDVSGGGARFVAELPPPAGLDVCFRLETPTKSGWVSARVVRRDGPAAGGLSFSGNCPYLLAPGLTPS
jgi:PilZ domain